MTEEKKVSELIESGEYRSYRDVLNAGFVGLAGSEFAAFFKLIQSFVVFSVKEDSEHIETMAVTQINGKNIFMFNEGFIKTLTFDSLKIIIKHECLHIVFNHIKRSKKIVETLVQKRPMLNEETMYRIANYVQDALINSALDNPLPTMVTHKTILALFGVVSEDSKSFETTFCEIMEKLIAENKEPKKGDGSEKKSGAPNDVSQSPGDALKDLTESMSDEELEDALRQMDVTPTGTRKGDEKALQEAASSEHSKQMNEQRNNQIGASVENAVKDYSQKRGTTPLSMTTEAKASRHKAKLNIKKLLNDIFSRSGISAQDTVQTYRKIHRHQYGDALQGISLMGDEEEENISICIATDTSGSMNGNWMGKIRNEIIAMFKSGIILIERMYFCDSEVQKAIDSDKLETANSISREFKRYGNGGTSVIPVLKEFVKDNSECLFYFTDGYIDSPQEVRNTLTPQELKVLQKKKIFWVFINNKANYKVFSRDVTLHLELPNDEE